MRILHVIVGLGVGGAEQMLNRLVLANSRDHEHIIVSLTTRGEIGAALADAGIHVEALGLRSGRDLPGVVWRLRRRIRDVRPDIVQTWMYHGDLLGGLAARMAGHRAVVWGIHASQMLAGTPRTTRAARWLCARLSSRIPASIVCVAETSRRVHEAIGYDPSRMVVLPNGFATGGVAEPSRVREFRESLGWSEEELVIGTVGRFDPYKDYPNLLRAAARVAAREPRARFLLVGRGLDASNAALVGWLAQHDLAGRFALLGSRTDVPLCLAAMDVFVLSSRSEAFPLVVGEAMGAAIPCVVTDVGDVASVVAHTGRVVPPEDAGALAGALIDMLALPVASRRALGAAARRRIEDEFSLEHTIDRYLELYRGIIAPKEAA